MEFDDRESLLAYVKDYCNSQGFYTNIKQSHKRKVWIKCNLGGSYRSRKLDNSRETSSRLIDCPFLVVAREFPCLSKWKILQIVDEHNHKPLQNSNGNPGARKLNEDEKEKVVQLLKSGVKTSQVLSLLRMDFHNNTTTAKDIYNIAQAIRRDILRGRSAIFALYESLKTKNFVFDVDLNVDGSVERLFFSYQNSVELSKRQNVFVMDSTYRTNKFGMPLLNIVGITSTYNTFSGGFIFMREETQSDYKWAMEKFKEHVQVKPTVVVTDRELALINAVEEVFLVTKHLLSLWHIKKNILAKCKSNFSDEDWEIFLGDINKIFSSKSEEKFLEACNVSYGSYDYCNLIFRVPHFFRFLCH